MRKTRKQWLLAAAVGLAWGAPGAAWAGDFVFSSSGDWNNGANWTPTGPPGMLDRADIAGGTTAAISSTPASAIDTLYVGGNTDGPSANDNATSNTSGDGTLNQTAGDLVVNTWAVLGTVGPQGASPANAGTGTYNLSGGTFTLNGTDAFTVGQGGTGVFNLSGNATATINSTMNVGRWSGPDTTAPGGNAQGRGNGTVVQSGNSTLSVVGQGTLAMNIGQFGDGTYTLKDNATLNAAEDILVGLGASSNGTLNQSGGTLNHTGGWFYIAHDTGSTGTYNLSGGNANVAGRFIVGFSGNGTMNQTGGNLTVGVPGGTNQDVNVADAGGTGTYNLSGGSLTANGGLWVGEWNNGNGTMNVSGNAAVTTTDLGVGRDDPASDPTQVSTTGTVNQTGGTVTVQGATILGIDPGGNSNGNTTGTYNLSGGTLVLGQSGLQLGGTGTQGATGATGIFNLRGTGVLEASRGTLQIGAGAGATSAFNMTGGTLQNAATIMFPLNQQGGTFQPGDPGAPATTMLTGDGTNGYTLASGATFRVEVAGTTADQLQVTNGNTTLAGLLSVGIDGPAAPRHDASVTILTGQNITGTFSNAATTYISSQGLYHVNYSPTEVTLSGFSLPGDANEDGSVDFTDLLTLAQHYGQSGQTWNTGDFNNNGSVAFDDLLTLAQHYGQDNTAPVTAVAAVSAVPEPVSLSLLTAPALSLLVRRRRRR